jgi:transposase
MTAPMALDGPITGPAFLAYVQQLLTPILDPRKTAIMDNLPAHKTAGMRAAIEATGAALRLLPPYSPDFNPIENAFAKFKACLRKSVPRTIPDCGMPSAMRCRNLRNGNVPTTSLRADMSQSDQILL